MNTWIDHSSLHRFLSIALQYPTIRSLHFDTTATGGYSAPLQDCLKHIEQQWINLTETGADHTLRLLKPHVSLAIGKTYFAEIAKLRAWYVLWYNMQKRWNLPISTPDIAVQFDPTAYTNQVYTNLIRATTMAMSAVIGGCTSLTVLPFDQGQIDQHNHGPEFGKRIARNVQHLLKMESGMHLLADPAAGSYYVEDLTRQIADKAWQQALGVS